MVSSTDASSATLAVAVRLPPPCAPLLAVQARPLLLAASLSRQLAAQGHPTELVLCCDPHADIMHHFVVSVWLRYLELAGETFEYPEQAFQEDYVWDIGATLHREHRDDYHYSATRLFPEADSTATFAHLQKQIRSLLGETRYQQVYSLASSAILDSYQRDMNALDILNSQWSENQKSCPDALNTLMLTKLKKTHAIHIAPTTLMRAGKNAAISPSTESAVTLRELYTEVGVPATIDHFMSKRYDQPLDFDIEQAKPGKTHHLATRIKAANTALQQQATAIL